ncbi:MAG: response regulator transcription factor [Bacteroidia bacterium]|nr:response regulator transcription factor [Bacteroidia bacterium]
MNCKTIVICDDHVLFANGLAELLTKFGSNLTIITYNNAADCKAYFNQNTANVFICDLNIGNVDGFVLLKDLKEKLCATKTIIISAYFEPYLIAKAEKMGVQAFLKKETDIKTLLYVIEQPTNAPFYSNKETKKETNYYTSKDFTTVSKFRLSKQEIEIIKLIIDGKLSKEIADALHISKATVDTHRRNINKKLELSNSSSLIKFAHENNLFS